MSNPTQEGVKRWMAYNHAYIGAGVPYEDCACEDCTVGNLALRALDMREKLGEWDNDCSMVLDDYIELRKVVRGIIKKFDGDATKEGQK